MDRRRFPPAGPVNIGWEPGVFGEGGNLADDLRYRGKLEEMKALLKQYCRDLPHTYGEFKTA